MVKLALFASPLSRPLAELDGRLGLGLGWMLPPW